MLQGLQVDCEARVGTAAIHSQTRCKPHAFCSCRKTPRPFRQARRSLAHSKPKTVQTLCSFASAVSHTSVTAQSVTEAVAKATLDKPLFQHALHSIFSSLAWFGLAWVVTRYISRKSKECESPEVTLIVTGCLWINMPGPSQPSLFVQEPAPAFLSELSPAVPRVKRPVYVHAGQAMLVAINVPVAVFLPMAAVVYSLRSIAWFLGVALASETRRQSFSEPLGQSHCLE